MAELKFNRVHKNGWFSYRQVGTTGAVFVDSRMLVQEAKDNPPQTIEEALASIVPPDTSAVEKAAAKAARAEARAAAKAERTANQKAKMEARLARLQEKAELAAAKAAAAAAKAEAMAAGQSASA